MNSGLLFSSFKVKHAEPLIRFHEKMSLVNSLDAELRSSTIPSKLHLHPVVAEESREEQPLVDKQSIRLSANGAK
jgi:hypothetical protein